MGGAALTHPTDAPGARFRIVTKASRSAARQRRKTSRAGLRGGFTLVELMVVIVIIGIIITGLLVVGADARRRAEEDATLALITKLDTALNDRLDALLQTRPTPNYAHGYLAGIHPGPNNEADGLPLMVPPALLFSGLPNPQCNTLLRAQVIATVDYIKAELPDVFFVDPAFLANPTGYTGPYPINFAGLPFPGTPVSSPAAFPSAGNYILPLGHMVQGPRNALTSANPNPWPTGYGDSHFDPTGTGVLVSTHPELGYTGSGINGASYTAAAGLYKNLGKNSANNFSYLEAGYDGVDNNGNGLIDEWAEGVNDPPSYTTPNANVVNQVKAALGLHQHQTARAEMLYALLVEGNGPLGSAFSRDDFTDREVKDTDGDGLPEFVDAWGQPLQFFRWPILYHTDSQKGQVITNLAFTPPYQSVFEAREQDPLDPNQQLMAPAWWSNGTGQPSSTGYNVSSPFATSLSPNLPPGNAGSVGGSGGVLAFEYFFHRITEPLVNNPAGTGFYWDRGTFFPQRRAFYTRPLILSSGPDKQLGVYLFPNAGPPGAKADDRAIQLLMVENNAMTFFNDFTNAANSNPTTYTITLPLQIIPDGTYDSYDPNDLTNANYGLQESGKDDISNQNRQASIGSGGP